MAIVDLRLNPFTNVLSAKAITNEEHTIPRTSPYTVRLTEVPRKDSPSTLIVKFSNGTTLSEVAANPASGQFWADYNTSPTGYDAWNTGTLLFSSADAGKTIRVSYNGIGTLVDNRLPDMLQLTVTGATQKTMNPDFSLNFPDDMLSTPWTSSITAPNVESGISAGTYTLRNLLQDLINRSHNHTNVKKSSTVNCNCNCSDCDDR